MLQPAVTFIERSIITIIKGKFSDSTLLFTPILIPLQLNSKNLLTMKKIVASLIVFGFAIAMVACGAKKEEAAAAADSVTTVIETTADVVDSAANAVVDSAAVVVN
jgi:hypothetical protein